MGNFLNCQRNKWFFTTFILRLKAMIFFLTCLFIYPTNGVLGENSDLRSRYIVFFKSSPTVQHFSSQFASFAQEENFYSSDLFQNFLGAQTGIKHIHYISSLFDTQVSPMSMDRFLSLPLLGIGQPDLQHFQYSGVLATVDFFSENEAKSELDSWLRQGLIWFYEVDVRSELSAQTIFTQSHRDLNLLGSRWWLDDLNIPQAIEELALQSDSKQLGISSPVIAVLDSGIDFEHPGLKDRMWINPVAGLTGCFNDTHGCSTANSTKGSLGDPRSYPFGTNRAGRLCRYDQQDAKQAMDSSCMHGTHVAGIIAGDMNGGIWGICPACRILNVKVIEDFDGAGKVSDSAILNALKYVSLFQRDGKNLVRVINSSFGKFQKSRGVSLYVSHLRHLRDGIVVIAAAGNEDSQRRVYPAATGDVIAVSAVAHSGKKASYSNFGPWVNIAAPGGDQSEGVEYAIESSIPGGGVALSQGTSMATPMVSAVAGLILSFNPDISFTQLKERILLSANPKLYDPDFADGYNYLHYFPKLPQEKKNTPLLGSGILDAYAAVRGVSYPGQKGSLQKIRVHPPSCGGIAFGAESSVEEEYFAERTGQIAFFTPIFLLVFLWFIRKLRSSLPS